MQAKKSTGSFFEAFEVAEVEMSFSKVGIINCLSFLIRWIFNLNCELSGFFINYISWNQCNTRKLQKFMKWWNWKRTFKTYVVGMSIEKLFDMWRNDEILKYYVICAAVSALSCLSQFCTSKKHIGIDCVKIRHFVTYQISFLLTCQPQ